jgi:hypothetical protein
MNEAKRNALLSRMDASITYRGGVAPKVLPLASIEDYFDGAEDEAGLFCNTDIAADDEKIALLSAIRARSDVADLRIAIVQCDRGERRRRGQLVPGRRQTGRDLVGRQSEHAGRADFGPLGLQESLALVRLSSRRDA